MTAEVHAFDGLSYIEDMACSIEPLAALPEAPTLARIDVQNAQTLVADASLGDTRRNSDPADEDAAIIADLHRLEFKVDVLLRLVAQLLARNEVLPPTLPVCLYAGGMEWRAAAADPAAGSAVRVRLYINPAFPQPLEFVGVACLPRRDGDRLWSRIAWHGVAPAVTDLLEKLIFRHHRRQIAVARTQGAIAAST